METVDQELLITEGSSRDSDASVARESAPLLHRDPTKVDAEPRKYKRILRTIPVILVIALLVIALLVTYYSAHVAHVDEAHAGDEVSEAKPSAKLALSSIDGSVSVAALPSETFPPQFCAFTDSPNKWSNACWNKTQLMLEYTALHPDIPDVARNLSQMLRRRTVAIVGSSIVQQQWMELSCAFAALNFTYSVVHFQHMWWRTATCVLFHEIEVQLCYVLADTGNLGGRVSLEEGLRSINLRDTDIVVFGISVGHHHLKDLKKETEDFVGNITDISQGPHPHFVFYEGSPMGCSDEPWGGEGPKISNPVVEDAGISVLKVYDKFLPLSTEYHSTMCIHWCQGGLLTNIFGRTFLNLLCEKQWPTAADDDWLSDLDDGRTLDQYAGHNFDRWHVSKYGSLSGDVYQGVDPPGLRKVLFPTSDPWYVPDQLTDANRKYYRQYLPENATESTRNQSANQS